MPQANDRLSNTTPYSVGSGTLKSIESYRKKESRENPFQFSDLETRLQQSESSPLNHINFESVNEPDCAHEDNDDSKEEASLLQSELSQENGLDIDDRVFFSEEGMVKWRDISKYVLIPGAIGGAGRWIRREMQLQRQVPPPVASNFWSSHSFYYSTTLGVIAAIIGNFVLARLLLKIDKNKLTYMGLSLVFGLFYSSVFAMGGQTVLSSEDKLGHNQGVATTSDQQEVQQAALVSNKVIAASSDDPDVKEEAIQVSETIALRSTHASVQNEAIETSKAIALHSDNASVQGEALEASRAIATREEVDEVVQQNAIAASEAIATRSTDDGVKQEAIATSEAIATGDTSNANVQQEAIESSKKIAINETVEVREQAINSTAAILEIATDIEIQNAAVQSIRELTITPEATQTDQNLYQTALKALGQIDTERLDPSVVVQINESKEEFEEALQLN
ncbi:MAG: hypothetical protein AAGD25_09275 [Cyanobacteria bacterium P01_F01_bin.150]